MKFPDVGGGESWRHDSRAARGARSGAAGCSLHDNEKIDDDYLDGLRESALPGAKFAGMKIVLDCANGAASKLAPRLFRSLGAEVVAMNDTPDGRNINAGCGSLHPEAMQKRVVETGAALGVAFDGDADRAIFSSASGRLVDGDGVLLVAGRYLKVRGEAEGRCDRRDHHGEPGPGARAGKIGIEAGAHGRGRPLRARGDAAQRREPGRRAVRAHFVSGRRDDRRRNVDGGEDRFDCRAAGPLDALVADLKIFPQKIVNVRVKAKPPLDSLPGGFASPGRSRTALGKSGRVVLRYSGTEPLARVMVEAEHEDDVRRWTDALAEALRKAIGA